MMTSFTSIRKAVHCAAGSGVDMKQELSLLLLFRKIACCIFKSLYHCSASLFGITLPAVVATRQCPNMSSVQYRSYRQIH